MDPRPHFHYHRDDDGAENHYQRSENASRSDGLDRVHGYLKESRVLSKCCVR